MANLGFVENVRGQFCPVVVFSFVRPSFRITTGLFLVFSPRLSIRRQERVTQFRFRKTSGRVNLAKDIYLKVMGVVNSTSGSILTNLVRVVSGNYVTRVASLKDFRGCRACEGENYLNFLRFAPICLSLVIKRVRAIRFGSM